MALSAVAFHFNVPQRQDYTCRLLRKAHRAGARVVVSAAAETLAELDRALWVYDALEFVPHWRGASIERLPARLKDTPIVLLERPSPAGGHGVLVNLGDQVPEAAADFERVIEIVGRAEDDRVRARERWRHYGAMGVAIERHEFKA